MHTHEFQLKAVFFLFLGSFLIPTGVRAGNSGGYRGPKRDGHFPATGLLQEWPKEGPKLLWKYDKLGWGYSSPTVANDMIYLTGQDPVTRVGYLFAFTLDGALKWKRPYGTEFGAGRCSGPRGSVTVSDGLIIVPNAFDGYRNIYCFKEETGEFVWHAEPSATYRCAKQGWGYNESPMVMGDKVIISLLVRDDKSPPVIALDKRTGKTIWTAAPADDKRGYSSADGSVIGYEHNGREFVLAALCRATICLDANTGKLLWKRVHSSVHQLTPVYYDGYLLVPSLKGKGKYSLLKLSKDGKSYEELHELSLDGLTQALFMNDRLFVVQSQGRKKPLALTCVDVAGGKVLQQKPAFDAGSLVAAEGMVYWLEGGGRGMGASNEYAPGYGVDGRLSLVKPTKEGFEIMGHFKPLRGLRDSWIHPTIAEGLLLHRHQPLLAVYDIRAEKPSYGFRNDGTGNYPHAIPLKKWWTPNIKWSAKLPASGRTAAVVVYGKAFVSCETGSMCCLDAATGKLLWSQGPGKRLRNAGGAGTPIVDLQREVVCALTADDVPIYLDWAGKPVIDNVSRTKDALQERYNKLVKTESAGTSGSELYRDGIMYKLHDTGVFTASDAATGKEIYMQASDDDAGPIDETAAAQLLATHDTIFATFGGKRARTVLVKPGAKFEKIWEFEVENGPAFLSFSATDMFIRAGDRLYCIGGSVPVEPAAPVDTPVVEPEPVRGKAGITTVGRSNVTITNWLCAGPFTPSTIQVDFLASLGGADKAQPVEGTEIKFVPKPVTEPVEDPDCAPPTGDAATRSFARFDAAKMVWRAKNKWSQSLDPLDLTVLTGSVHLGGGSWRRSQNRAETWYFYTVLSVDKERIVKFRLLTPGGEKWMTLDLLKAKVWIAGKPVDLGRWHEGRLIETRECFRLKRGRYPVMVQLAVGRALRVWDKIWAAPRFIEHDVEAADAQQMKEYKKQKAEWEKYQAALQKGVVLE